MNTINERTKKLFKETLAIKDKSLTEEQLELISNFTINYFNNHLKCVAHIDSFLQYAFRWGMLDSPWKTFDDGSIGEDQRNHWKEVEEWSIKCRDVHTPNNGFSII